MPIRTNHHASKAIEDTPKVGWDSVLTEALIGFVCGGFAYMGYSGGILTLFFLNGIIALVCSASLFFTLISGIKRHIKNRQRRETDRATEK